MGLEGSTDNWNLGTLPKLWVYNAHYFDDLLGAHWPVRSDWHQTLIELWLGENPPGARPGWDPYPTSLRLVNWIAWSWAGNRLSERALHSLAVQARFLRERLEWHLLGNHLWANAKAMTFAGAFFEGVEATSWLDKGLDLLDRELDEQVLPDGGHFERSPMYHAIILADLLDLLQLSSLHPDLIGSERTDRWTRTALSMQRWLSVMSHPDGGIAFFNDATLGIAPSLADIHDYARALGLRQAEQASAPLESLADSGYVRMQQGPVVLIADVGLIGPDYLPGHAHADTLSFEMSFFGQRIFVNRGISTYEVSAERLEQRGTAAHTTLQLDRQDSSEVWSSFRVGRRARPMRVRCEPGLDEQGLRACHDGYAWLPGNPIACRRWQLSSHGLIVGDSIEGHFGSAIVRFHLHPDCGIGIDSERGGWIRSHGRLIRWRASPSCKVGIDLSQWHPGFNQSIASNVLVIETSENAVETCFSWE